MAYENVLNRFRSSITVIYRQSRWFANGLKIGVLIHIFTEKFYSINAAVGPSMLPTLNLYGDKLLIDKTCRYGNGVKAGDIISFESPISERGICAAKRVIGMPGDFVEAFPPSAQSANTLQVCLIPSDDSVTGSKTDQIRKVPEGHCFVVGDNLPHSRDSRLYGAIPLALVRGKICARIWPDPKWFVNELKPSPSINDEEIT